MKLFFTLLTLFSPHFLIAQTSSFFISFTPTYNGVPMELEKAYGSDSLKIETLKFYISDISFFNQEQQWFKFQDGYQLLDFSNELKTGKSYGAPSYFSYSHIEFDLGVDSLTNVSGAMEGPLDPMNGMYWTWQSGYINFKLEGTAANCPTRKNEFTFHLGGYQAPYAGKQRISLPIENLPSTRDIEIEIPIDELFQKINLNDNNEIMSPCATSVEMAKILASVLKIKNN